MRKTSSSEPLYDSLALDSSPGNDLFSRRALKKRKQNLNVIRLERPARSREGSTQQQQHLYSSCTYLR